MKFTPSITLGLLLSLTANAAPFEKERKIHIESKRVVDALSKRDKSCFTDGGVNCRWDPYLNAEIITTTSAKKYNYLCWQEGDCFDGNWYVFVGLPKSQKKS